MTDDQMHYMEITEIANLIEKRDVSPVEITKMMLARIAELDGRYLSYATIMSEHAMTAADVAETEISNGHYRGPLHGIPIAVKDLCFTNGVRTMGGSKVYSDHIPGFDATVVERLKAAGAVIIGKLNLTEGAMGGYNPALQIPKNPWNFEKWTGSSSSGSGVATSVGLCYGSLGSDTGGSIRFPSAACGIVGLKPTWGRVSRYGVLPLAESLDHVGPMTRSAQDAAVMFQAIAGDDPNDPTTLSDPIPDMLDTIQGGVSGIRIGWDEHYATSGVNPELAESVSNALSVLESMGADIVTMKMPDVDHYLPAWPTLCSAEAVLAHVDNYPKRRNDYGLWFKGWLDNGSKITGSKYAKAHDMRAECNGLIRRAFLDIDVLACPSMTAPPHSVTEADGYGPMDDRRGTAFQRYTVPFDFNGYPTLSLPSGFTGDGLPLSLQIVGKNLSESLLCQIGYAYEEATDWHKMHPPDL